MKEKKHTSIDNQLEKLKGRNITIDQHEEKEIKKILLETVKRLVVETSVEQTGVTN